MTGSKKKIINLKDELKAPGFGRQEPLEGALLMAPINHISLYDRNPRREKNPRYAEIRASLLANGLREILNVTQRPDAKPEHYMIARGRQHGAADLQGYLSTEPRQAVSHHPLQLCGLDERERRPDRAYH